MPIEITDDRARLDVSQLLELYESISMFLLLTKEKPAFYERLAFLAEREMAMVLRQSPAA